jgi:hypothetical protein
MVFDSSLDARLNVSMSRDYIIDSILVIFHFYWCIIIHAHRDIFEHICLMMVTYSSLYSALDMI